MSNLPCYFGNPQSEHRAAPAAHQHQHSAGALPNRHNNALGVLHFAHLYGEEKVYSLRSSEQHGKANRERHLPRPPEPVRSRHQLRPVERPAEPGRPDQGDPPERGVRLGPIPGGQPGRHPLFVLDGKGRTRIVTGPVEPQAGELLIALQPPKETAAP